MNFATASIHSEQNFSKETGAITPPIFLSSTFEYGNSGNFDYTRSGNPNFRNLSTTISALEQSEYTSVFSSGIAAVTAVASTLKSGDKILAEENVYGCTFRIFEQVFKKFGIEILYIDLSNIKNFSEIEKYSPELIWIESPTNPLLKLVDIEKLSTIAKKFNIPVLVDNTFATPFFQKPLELGATLSLNSTTKYLNGHSDSLGGSVSTNDEKWSEKLEFAQKSLGLSPSAFDCFMISRGIKTLSLRMKQHAKNALQITEFLHSHPLIEWVKYPFHSSHPQYELAKKQMTGFSGMITARLKLSEEKTKEFLQQLQYFPLAESLGGIESLSCHPATMTHASVPQEIKESIGIYGGVIRLSVGIEDVEDLLEDLEKVLEKFSK